MNEGRKRKVVMRWEGRAMKRTMIREKQNKQKDMN